MYTPDGIERTQEEMLAEAARVKKIASLLKPTGIFRWIPESHMIAYQGPFSNTGEVQAILDGKFDSNTHIAFDPSDIITISLLPKAI